MDIMCSLKKIKHFTVKLFGDITEVNNVCKITTYYLYCKKTFTIIIKN